MKKVIEIKEKVELKDLEVQSNNPCKVPNPTVPCKHNCCKDCYNGQSAWQSDMY